MAREIIVLSAVVSPGQGTLTTSAFWLAVPANLQTGTVNTSITSQVPDASVAEMLALQNGTVAEQIFTIMAPFTMVAANLESVLQNNYTHQQQLLTATAPAKKWQTMTMDSSGVWTNVPA